MLRECPSSAPLVHPIVTGAPSVRLGESLRLVAATDRDPRIVASREEEPLPGNQGAFHCQRSAVCTSIARCDRVRIGLPSRRSYGRNIAKRTIHRSRWW